MSFMSVPFYGWLAAAVVAYRFVPARWRPVTLLVYSCLFCVAASPAAFGLVVGATVVAYGIGLRLANAPTDAARTAWLTAGVGVLVGALVAFKVAGAVSGVLVPLGLSYYTFKLVSYLAETYWDASQVERRFSRLAAYATFGAQMVSGPIQRPGPFFDQLDRAGSASPDDAQFERGLRLVLLGLVLKLVIGDRLGTFTALVTQAPERYSRGVVMVATASYLPQLYADFAGYTNIALGIGLLFGIEGPPNFDAPFSATNLQEYWRRWHMSLTSWLTDYVFMPLRMATRGLGQVGLVLSVIINMTLIGVWHGFTWSYLVFGVLNGVFLSVSVLTLKRREVFFKRWPWLRPLRVVAGIVCVQGLLALGQVFFQAQSLRGAWTLLSIVVGGSREGSLDFRDIRTDVVDPLFVCLILAVYLGAGAPGHRGVATLASRWVPNWIRYGVCLFGIAALTLEAGGVFIYGQF